MLDLRLLLLDLYFELISYVISEAANLLDLIPCAWPLAPSLGNLQRHVDLNHDMFDRSNKVLHEKLKVKRVFHLVQKVVTTFHNMRLLSKVLKDLNLCCWCFSIPMIKLV